jgi:hypothetical protein
MQDLKLPNLPGVYFLYDSRKNLIYIGKSYRLSERIAISAKERKSEFFKYSITKTCFDADLYEIYYIAKFRPRLNVSKWHGNDLTTINLPDLKFSEFNDCKTLFLEKHDKVKNNRLPNRNEITSKFISNNFDVLKPFNQKDIVLKIQYGLKISEKTARRRINDLVKSNYPVGKNGNYVLKSSVSKGQQTIYYFAKQSQSAV